MPISISKSDGDILTASDWNDHIHTIDTSTNLFYGKTPTTTGWTIGVGGIGPPGSLTNLTDDDINTATTWGTTNSNNHATVQVDLGTPMAVGAIAYKYSGKLGTGTINEFYGRLQISLDGTNWTNLPLYTFPATVDETIVTVSASMLTYNYVRYVNFEVWGYAPASQFSEYRFYSVQIWGV